MTDIRVKDLTEAATPGADYFLLTDSATDGVKKVKTSNIVTPADIGAASLAGVETLTNKTISGASNTLSGIPNSALTNSSVTIAGHAVSLGGSQAIAAGDLSAIANQTILANVSGASAAPAPSSLSSILDAVIGNTQGAIVTRKAAGWSVLGPGPSGTMLTSMGSAADLSYTAIPGGGGPIPIFDTFALAEAYSPVAAPKWIQTAFYDVDQIAASGAKYRKNGATTGHLVITLSDGTTQVGYDISSAKVSITAFGAKSSETAANNMTAFKAAIAATRTGGTVLIPEIGGTMVFDTTGGLTGAALIDRKMTVQIDGYVKTNYSAYEANPAYWLKVTAHNVTVRGTGVVEGDGNILIGAPAGSTSQMPGLIYVEDAKNFRYRGVKILRQPMVGISLAGASCLRARICDAEFMGGPASFHFSVLTTDYVTADPGYVGSAYFGIVASGGGDHVFSKLHFTRDDVGGGRVINAIFTSGYFGNSNGNKTLHCIAYYPYEKLLYGYGDKQVIAGNTVYGSGTSSVDTHTEAIRIWGSDSRAYGNITIGCRSGMQVLDGARNHVFGNQFKDCRSSGVNVQHFSDSYTGGIASNVIRDNYISRDGASVERRFGVRILSNTLMDFSSCEVSGNTLIGWGDTTDEIEYTIDLVATSPRNATNCVVKDNKIESCGNGVRLTRNIKGHVAGNDFNACTSIAIHLQAGARNIVESNTGENPGTYFLSYSVGGNEPTGSRFLNNRSNGATNIGIRNHAFGTASIWAKGNQWTDAPLIMGGTLSTSSATTSLTHGGVAPHAKIGFHPTEEYSSDKQASEGYYAVRNGTNIDVINGAAALAGVAATFFVEIHQ